MEICIPRGPGLRRKGLERLGMMRIEGSGERDREG
jgi:hypothetical protein